MNTVFKQLIILFLIIATGLGVYFGALLPLAKSQSFLDAQKSLGLMRTTDDLKKFYDVPLNLYSPIGQEEVVKFSASTFLDVVYGQQLDLQTARWLVSYIEPYLFKDEVRHLIMLGDMYRALWERYGGDPADFAKAGGYYLTAHRIGPKLPPVLYRLIEIYRERGDAGNVKKYAGIVL